MVKKQLKNAKTDFVFSVFASLCLCVFVSLRLLFFQHIEICLQ